jgi:prepilin signal peptidase PulO-like enzyme (type II secretory pathway)
MQTVELFLVIVFGLCFGSFATLASYRLPRGGGIIAGRSRCPNCQKDILARDLIPVLSWLLRRGRCRHCQRYFSFRYPLIEIIAASLCVLVYVLHGISLASVLLMLMSVVLLVMVVVDMEHMIIPDEVHLALLILALGYHAAVGSPPGNVAAGFVIMLAAGLLLHHGYYYIRGRDGLGYGDVKFFALAGIWLGLLPLVPFLFIAGGLGVMTGLLWKIRGKGDLFPFAPSLAVALWVCILWPNLVNIMLFIDK